MSFGRVCIAAMLMGLVNCADQAPPLEPNWQADVMPILAANCVGCHGAEASGGAPPTLRLDSIDPVPVESGGKLAGAGSAATQIFKRVTGKGLLRNEISMPPRESLSEYDLAVLRNWAALADGTGTAPRGAARDGNHPPTVTITETARSSAGVELRIELADPDGDPVLATLIGPRFDGTKVVTGPIVCLTNAQPTWVWPAKGVPAGTYQISVQLDDGAEQSQPQPAIMLTLAP
jgi:hypothetical protein